MRIFKIIAISLLSLLALLMLAVFITLRFYEDDVVNYATAQAKTKFKTLVEFGPTDLTFWQTFPNASLRFTDVYIEETFDTKDTLLFAEKIYLEFNLLQLFRGQYNIKAIEISDAFCNMKIDEKGNDNYHFWKEDKTDTSEFKFELDEINLKHTMVSYDNKKNDFNVKLQSEEATAKGKFTSQNLALQLEANTFVHELKNNNETYALNQTLIADADIEMDISNSEYKIIRSEIEWGEAGLSLDGILNFSEKEKTDIHIKAEQLDLDDVKNSLPASLKRSLNNYNADGDLNLDITLSKNGKKPLVINATCNIMDGEFKHNKSGVALDDIQCELKYVTKDKAEVLTIRTLKARMNTGFLEASGSVKNLNEPMLDIQLSTQAELNDVKKFFAWDTLEICTGSLTATTTLKGKLIYNKTDSTYNWNALQTAGEAQIENGVLRIKNSTREVRDLQASVQFVNSNAAVKNLSGTVNGSDFKIDGDIQNLLPFLTSEDEKITLNATLKSEFLDFTNLIETSASTSADESYHFKLPERISFRLNSSIKKFVFRKFEATDVKGIVQMHNQRLVVDPVSFQTAEGAFSAQIAFEEATESLYRINCLANLKGINIQKLFVEFENFDQTFIQDKNLKGIANARVQFRTLLTTELNIVQDKIESLIDISIENGELNNLESLQDIAAYIKGNKWAAPFVDEDRFAEKMRNIKFSKLENVIEIKDRLITIPQMEINTTALDISAKGTHHFDNSIDYTIGFSLRDVLVRKETQWNVADDGLGKHLFVSMKGSTANPIFMIDKDAAKENRQDEIQAEKQNVKAMLKEEFGLFKKDNSIATVKEKTTPTGSITTIEWSELDNADPTEKQIDKPTKIEEKKQDPIIIKEPKKKVPKWLEEKK